MSESSTNPQDLAIAHCDREPIHIPGSIQPHGMLLAVRESDGLITHASANAGQLAATSTPPVGMKLEQFLDGASWTAIQQELGNLDQYPRLIGRTSGVACSACSILAHRHAGATIIELEPEAEVEIGSGMLQDRLARETARLERTETVESLCEVAAAAVQRLTGYEKVMIYRFDEEWNGTVLAEVGPAEMEPYLGLRFPASDIPAQARELYRLNPVRLIVDVQYAAVPLVASEGAPLDLSYSILRSVSPIHVEYLKNMHVAASMSFSILRDGELWGLIVCHHRTPRFVPHAVRSACVVLARLVAQFVSTIEAGRETKYAVEVRAIQGRLLKKVADTDNLVEVLGNSGEELLGLVDAEGAAVCMDGECRLIGKTPTAEEVTGIAEWLVGSDLPLFYTDRLSTSYPLGQKFCHRASGVLAITLSSVYRRFVMWFRPELIQTVNWAGDPKKPVEPGSPRLHPRKSFQVWKEQVGCKSRAWRKPELDVAALLRESLVDALLRKTEEAAAKAKDQFLAVLSHELRTPLSPVLTAASALENDVSLPEETRDLMRLIRRNVEVETRLIDDLLDLTRISKGKLIINPETVDVHLLIERTLEILERDLQEKGIRVAMSIGAVAHHVEGDPARLQQVFWNVLRNAIKFTPPGGSITIGSMNESRGRIQLEFIDSGAGIEPQVLPYIFNAFEQGGRTVTRRFGGLGLGLAIARTLMEIHRGRITASSEGQGRGATFTIDLPTIIAPKSAASSEVSSVSAVGEVPSKLHILLVEDHQDTARVMARLLRQLKYEIKTAESVAAARKLASSYSFDLVISDLGLPDGSGNDLMRELHDQHGVKGIALTGWGMEEDVRRSREAGFERHLTKPVDFQSLQAAIREVVGQRG